MRNQTIVVDINKEICKILKYKQYDNNNLLQIIVEENYKKVNLEGYFGFALFQLPSGIIIKKDCEIQENVISTTIDNNILSEDGTVALDLTLSDGEKTFTLFRIVLTIEKTIDRDEAIIIEAGWDIVAEIAKFRIEEVQRQADETQRLIKEEQRLKEEVDRQDEEIKRKANETQRLINEEQRISKENKRLTDEELRTINENKRLEKEEQRLNDEQKRISAEEIRLRKEIERLQNELDRQNAEIIRIEYEEKRMEKERERLINEEQRLANEKQRQSNEVNRITVEEDRIANEEVRISNEANRVTVEQERVEAENIRQEFYDGFNSQLEQNTNDLANIKHVEVNILDYSDLVVNDDWTMAINQAITDIPSMTIRDKEKYVLRIPRGTYYISDTILINKNVDIICVGTLVYNGPRDRSAVKISGQNMCNYYFYRIMDIGSRNDEALYTGWHGWSDENYVGLQTVNLKSCNINVELILNFTVGKKCTANNGNGWWFNNVRIKEITNCKIGLELNSNGNNSWLNANYFYDTAFGYSGSGQPFTTFSVDRYDIKQTLTNGNTYGGDSNFFYNMKHESHDTFGGTHTAIYINKAYSWVFNNIRSELLSPNSTFARINCDDFGSTGITASAHSSNIQFKSFATKYGVGVVLENAEKLRCDYTEIYSMDTPIIYNEIVNVNFYKSTLQINNNYHVTTQFAYCDNVAKKHLDETLMSGGYNSGKVNTDGSINLTGSYPCAVIVKNVKKGDRFIIYKESGNEIGVKSYDENGNILNESSNRYIAMYGYYNQTCFAWTHHLNTNNREYFTIHDDRVKHICITLFGGSVRYFKLETTSKTAQVTHLTASQQKTYPNLGYNTKPTYIGENYMPGTRVYNQNDPKIFWEIAKDPTAGVLIWKDN